MTTLFAPPDFWRLSAIAKKKICNGCGSKGLCGYVIPDTIWGLKITAACDIHDFMYAIGKTLEDKKEADRVFFNNMLRLIDKGSPWLKWLRRRRAKTYYDAVCLLGGPAFWAGKNKGEELGAVCYA